MSCELQEAPLVCLRSYPGLNPVVSVFPEGDGPQERRTFRIGLLQSQEVILIANEAWEPENPFLRIVLQATSPRAVPVMVRARVIKNLSLPNGNYVIGCEFLPPLKPESLALLR